MQTTLEVSGGGPVRGVPRPARPVDGPTKKVMIYDLMQNQRPVFVNFPPRDGVVSGPVFQLHHPDHQDGVRLDPIPMGRAPIDLTAMCPHEHLKRCGDLYTAIRKGYLTLWDPDEAMEWIARHGDEAQEIQRKIDEIMKAERSIDPRFIVRSEGGSPEDMINPQVVSICLDVKEGQVSPENALSDLMKMEPDLADQDIDYVYAWSNRYALQKWAQDTMVSRQSNPEYMARREAENERLIAERRARGMAGDMAGVATSHFDEVIGDPNKVPEAADLLRGIRQNLGMPDPSADPTAPR